MPSNEDMELVKKSPSTGQGTTGQNQDNELTNRTMNRRDEPSSSMSTAKKVVGGVAILLALALIIGIPVGLTIKPQVPIPDDGPLTNCTVCSGQGFTCISGEKGTSKRCPIGTVACVNGTAGGKPQRSCGPVSSLGPKLKLNECVSITIGSGEETMACACDTRNNCNQDPNSRSN